MSIVKNITSVDNLDWREIVINWEGMGDDVTEIKAGTPMDADGNIANNSNCFGLMMGDVLRTRSRARVVISGPVDLDEAEANSGITLSDEAKAAIRDVWFPGKSGGGLPTGGAAYQQLVTDGEGNAKWEDRLAYETDQIIAEVFPEQTIAFSLQNNAYMASTSQQHVFVVGNQYTVKWDGTEYECVCSEFSGIAYIGNQSILTGMDDTGEPFFIFAQGTLLFYTANTSPEHTVYIYTKSVEIKKISDKFLEKDVFVVNATITYPSTLIESADKTFSEILSAARENKRCILITNNSGASRIYEMCPLNDNKENEIRFRSFEFSKIDSYDSGFSGTEYIVTSENKWSCENFTLNNPITSSGVQDITGVKTFFKDCLVINSSTSGSSKKFKITVDDSGTISATEV